MLLLAQLLLTFLTLAFALPVHHRHHRHGHSGSLYGVTYTGYGSFGNCHTESEVKAMVDRFSRNGVQSIRTYSQECDLLPKLLSAVQGTGIKIVAGVWLDGDVNDDQAEINSLIKTLSSSSSDAVSAILVGNECVLENRLSSSTLVRYIQQVKDAVGGRYPVGTADTPTSYNNKALLDASDVVYVNIHPFFGGVAASDAISNLRAQLAEFKTKTSKEVIIGEVGWPTTGERNQNAVPGLKQLSTVVRGLMTATDLKYHFFESHDSEWKQVGAFAAEPHWGLIDRNGKSKIPEFI